MSQIPTIEQQKDTARAGRGGLALTLGKLFFIVAGLVQQVALKAILGLSGYGALSTTLSIASIAYNPMVQAGIQGMSRETAGLSDAERPVVARHLLKIHAVVAAVLAVLFFFLAPVLARVLGAPHIAAGVRALSVVLFLYGLYAPLVGLLNGQKRFLAQAGLDAFAAAVRTVGLLGGAYFGVRWAATSGPSESRIDAAALPVLATCLGFVGSATIVVLVAARITGTGKTGVAQPGETQKYERILRHIWAGQLLLNLLFQADALLLRRFASDAAHLAQLPEAAADPYVGAFRATQLFCFLPFQLLTSVTFVLFPLLAQAKARAQTVEVARLVERGLRLSTLVIGVLISVLLSRADGLLTLVFGAETAALASSAMRILAPGMGAFALLGVLTAVLNSLGQERLSLVLFTVATLSVTALCFVLVHGQSLSQAMLNRTALATSLAMLTTTLLALVLVHKTIGCSLAPSTACRTILAVAASAWITAQLLPPGLLWTLVAALVTPTLYLVVQLLSRELKAADLHGLLALGRR